LNKRARCNYFPKATWRPCWVLEWYEGHRRWLINVFSPSAFDLQILPMEKEEKNGRLYRDAQWTGLVAATILEGFRCDFQGNRVGLSIQALSAVPTKWRISAHQHFAISAEPRLSSWRLLCPSSCGQACLRTGYHHRSISGSVTDPTGAIIPGSTVKVVGESTGANFEVKTNGEGEFNVTDVPLGLYTVTITANGFGPASTTHVRVIAGNNTSVASRL